MQRRDIGTNGESHMENWKRREKTLTAPFPFLPATAAVWRATLIKHRDPGQLARLILKRRQRAPESPLIISLLL